jgi:ArsR family transcriptional regulator, arsenate/arsenite/antimonite-responsive transcriptional repressor
MAEAWYIRLTGLPTLPHVIMVAMDRRAFTRISKALADPRRYAILRRIAGCESETSCALLKEKFPISRATLSHHLKELTNAGLIQIRRDSRFLYVQLSRDTWREYLDELSALAR